MKLPPKVVTVKKIGFQNVVSKRETFYYTQLEEKYKQFMVDITSAGYRLKGPFFYSMNNVPLDKMVDIELFFPIYDEVFSVENYQFRSYFEINQLVKTIIIGDFETTTEQSYAELLATLEMNKFSIETPFYHVYPKNGSRYVNLYLGY